MKIFLTGGTGFLGKRVVKRFLQEGHELTMLVRNKSSVNDERIELVQGDLESIGNWQHHLQGMDVVVHMAAPVVFWGEWSMYERLVVQATKALHEASEKSEVSKFIYISSESVLQEKADLLHINERHPYPKEPNSYYGKSKMLAEQYLLARKTKMETVILRPTFIWGTGVMGLQSMIKKIKTGGFSWINKGEFMVEMVHVENVAEAIYLSCLKGRDKDVFFVTDDAPKKAKAFFTDLLATQHVTVPNKSLPKQVAVPAAALVEMIWRAFKFKKEPPLTRFDLAFIAMNRTYDITAIKSRLGYKPIVSYEKGLEKMKQHIE